MEQAYRALENRVNDLQMNNATLAKLLEAYKHGHRPTREAGDAQGANGGRAAAADGTQSSKL